MRALLPAIALAVALTPYSRGLAASPAVLAGAPAPGAGLLTAPRPVAYHPTQLRYLPGNNDAWYARWYALEQATESIDVTYFNFHKDLFGKALLGKLHEKAQEGLAIRLMVDSRGSLGLATRFAAQAYLREMASFPNVEVRVFKPLVGGILRIPRDLRQVVASNHDKILLADGHLAVVGGRNLGEKYFADPGDHEHAYRDSDLLLEGAEVGARVAEAFAVEFEHLDNLNVDELRHGDREGLVREIGLARQVMDRWIRGGGLMDPEEQPGWRLRRLLKKLNKVMVRHQALRGYEAFAHAPFARGGTYPARVLDKRSFGDPENDITEKMLALLDGAEESILIQNAYLVLTDRVYEALKAARARGVEVRILTNSPASTSNLLTQAFFVRDWKKWMHEIPGLRIFMVVDDHKIHAKTFVIDGQVVSVGSYNLDPMSETINSELMTLVRSADLAAEVTARIEGILADAVECEIRVNDDGEIEGVRGPDDYLSGIAGFLTRVLSKITFLRDLV